MSYSFVSGQTLYEVGFNDFEQEQITHTVALRLIYLIFATSGAIVLFFPGLFRTNLVNPLNALLNGIKQAVQYEDEIGFLTHSFNGMIKSIQVKLILTTTMNRLIITGKFQNNFAQ